MDLVTAGIILAILIIAHHIYIHSDYDFPDRAFQVSDVQNHETWIIASLALATGAYFAAMSVTEVHYLLLLYEELPNEKPTEKSTEKPIEEKK